MALWRVLWLVFRNLAVVPVAGGFTLVWVLLWMFVVSPDEDSVVPFPGTPTSPLHHEPLVFVTFCLILTSLIVRLERSTRWELAVAWGGVVFMHGVAWLGFNLSVGRYGIAFVWPKTPLAGAAYWTSGTAAFLTTAWILLKNLQESIGNARLRIVARHLAVLPVTGVLFAATFLLLDRLAVGTIDHESNTIQLSLLHPMAFMLVLLVCTSILAAGVLRSRWMLAGWISIAVHSVSAVALHIVGLVAGESAAGRLGPGLLLVSYVLSMAVTVVAILGAAATSLRHQLSQAT